MNNIEIEFPDAHEYDYDSNIDYDQLMEEQNGGTIIIRNRKTRKVVKQDPKAHKKNKFRFMNK